MFVPVICQVKTTRVSNFYCFLGVSIHDCRDSQPSSGWLKKVGVLDFVLLPPLLLPFASKCEPDGLPYAFSDYLMLVDWAGRAIRTDKQGYIPACLAPILVRLGLDGARWLKQVMLFRRQGLRVVGDKAHCRQFAHHCGQQRCHQPPY
ncbi:hypothetical protein ACFU5E_06510 [Aeromonas bestiarum]|uniref:hypothetical protein n=1 Tax=Aeromonas bestiarum TaxID=105751 RepID=UPI00366D9033